MACIDIKKCAKSFVCAGRGIGVLFRTQQNARVHAVAALAVIAAGFYFEISRSDWLWLVAAMALVLITEAINTAIEAVADAVTMDHHPFIARAKDCAAGAVLLAAIAAVIIGAILFLPHIRAL